MTAAAAPAPYLRLVVYSGHCEIVGGDAKYLFDLLAGLDLDAVDVTLLTDINAAFVHRARQGLRPDVPVTYLDTRPALFPGTWVDRLYARLESSARRGALGERLWRVLNVRVGGRSAHRLLRRAVLVAVHVAGLHWLRDPIRNVRLFTAFFAGRAGTVDVFHANNGGYPAKEAALLAVLAAARAGVPRIFMTCHNLPAARGRFAWRARALDALVRRTGVTIIAASDIIRQRLIRDRGFDAAQVVTVYCGLADPVGASAADLAAARRELGLPDGDAVVLVAGAYDEDRKGHSCLIRAMAQVREAVPSARLLIAGDGQPWRRAALESVARDAGVFDAVHFLGYRTDMDVLNAIADVCVVPSVGAEATPYTIKEAARASRPIVTTSAGGCAEAVDSGASGLIVTPGDAAALAGAVTQLLRDPVRRQAMGAAGRRLFEQRFRLDDKIAAHLALYRGGRPLTAPSPKLIGTEFPA